MKDFIFVTGASGIGKSTLCKGLFDHYRTTVVEQHMVPEFITRDGEKEVTGVLEELTCWEVQVAMMKKFHDLGYRNIIGADIDDLRTADIPIVFKGYEYVTIKLICHDPNQLQEQMKNRPNNGLIDYELQRKMNEKNLAREPLVNEIEIDITGKMPEEVCKEAIQIIDNTESILEYEYKKPKKELFYSWVSANGLR